MYKKRMLNDLLFSGYTHFLALAMTTNLFSSIDKYLLTLPHEIVCSIVILQEEQDDTWISEQFKSLDIKEYVNKIQRYILPCYRLLMTCKGFYQNITLKKSLHMGILNFPSLIQNIFELNRFLKKSHLLELKLTSGSYLNDMKMQKYDDFFQPNLNNIITIKRETNKRTLSLSKFLIENMKKIISNNYIKYGYDGAKLAFKNHFKILDLICTATNLTLPILDLSKQDLEQNENLEQNIAEFIFHELSKDTEIAKTLCSMMKIIPKEPLEIYKKRYKLDAIPEKGPIALTIFLSDEAFEKLSSVAKSKIKSDEYKKKPLSWILPEIPEQSRLAYFVSQIHKTLSIFFKKIYLLISIIKDR